MTEMSFSRFCRGARLIAALSLAVSFLAAGACAGYVAPQPYTYESFPEYGEIGEDVKTLNVSGKEISVSYLPLVPYVARPQGVRSLQILLPRSRAGGRYPLIVYVQGSAWMKQDVHINVGNLAKFAAKGYTIALVQYRESKLAPFPAQIEDAKTAIRFMRLHADEYHVDSRNVFLWGDSSGGHTAVMAGITGSRELDSDVYGGFSCAVNGIIDFFGPTDIRTMNNYPSMMDHRGKDSPEGMLIGGKRVDENEKLAAETAVVNHIVQGRDTPPLIMFHGTKDRLVSCNQSLTLFRMMKKQGRDVQLYCLKGADHGDPAFWSDQMMALVDGFIRKNIR